ncbi:MAG: hypothetical protein RL684_857 [Pseudomonadota bacterium]|jgi:hypothetical protein
MTTIAKYCLTLLATAVLAACTERLTTADTLTLQGIAQSPGSGFKRFDVEPSARIVWITPLPGANLDDIAYVVCTRIPAVRQVNFHSGEGDTATKASVAPTASRSCEQQQQRVGAPS